MSDADALDALLASLFVTRLNLGEKTFRRAVDAARIAVAEAVLREAKRRTSPAKRRPTSTNVVPFSGISKKLCKVSSEAE